MKILLVWLPFCTPVSPSYSLANLQASLDVDVEILDLNLLFHQKKFPKAQKYFTAGDWDDYEDFARRYHQQTKKVYSENNSKVVRGEKPEYFSEFIQMIEDSSADIVAFSVVYSSQAFYANALLKELKMKTAVGGPAVNQKLTELADYTEADLMKYMTAKKPLFFPQGYFVPQAVIPLRTTTTCFHQKCTFCTHFAKVPYQEIPLEDIKVAIENSGAKHFFLIDDMIPLPRLLKLAELFKGMKWGCQLRPTKEYIPHLDKLGLSWVLWGFESGSQETLDKMRKGTNVTDVELILQAASKAGIKNVLYTMFGFPGDDGQATLDFLDRNADYIDLVSTSTFGLQVGSEVYQNPGDYGLTILEEIRTILDPKISFSPKLDCKKLVKRAEAYNKYPKMMNFFREHLFFV